MYKEEPLSVAYPGTPIKRLIYFFTTHALQLQLVEIGHVNSRIYIQQQTRVLKRGVSTL